MPSLAPRPSSLALRLSSFALRWWAGIVVVLVLFGGMFLIQRRLDATREAAQLRKGVDELMYFPSGKLLTQIAGEYRPLVADYAWLRAIQYFAYHSTRDQNYEWLGHIIRTIGQLDPHFVEAYRFGSLILAWDSDKPEEAIALLRTGMAENPLNWELPFQIAFVAYVKMKDYALAADYFDVAAKLPDVWSIAPRWAAVASQKSGNVELARQIWTEIWRTHPNQRLKDLARRQLVDVLRQELGVLQAAVDSFAQVRGRLPLSLRELMDENYLNQTPIEPFGGVFALSRSGRVISSSVETVRRLVSQLQMRVDRYRSEKGTAPTDMADLVRAGYLDEVPTDPFGGIMVIEEGRVRITLNLP